MFSIVCSVNAGVWHVASPEVLLQPPVTDASNGPHLHLTSHDGALLCFPFLRTSWQIKGIWVKVKTWRLKEKEELEKCFLGER